MEHISATTLEKPQTAPSKELAATVDQLGAIDAQLTLIHQIKAAEAEQDPQLEERIQDLELSAIMAGKNPDILMMLDSMAKASHGELAAYLNQNLETMTPAVANYDALMEKGEKLALQELERLQVFIRQNIAWELLIHERFGGEPHNRSFDLKELNHLLQPPSEPISLWILHQSLVRLQTIKDTLTQEGYVVDRKSEAKEDEKEAPIAEIREWMEDTQAAIRLLSPSRVEHLLKGDGFEKTEQVASLINSISARGDMPDPTIAHALKKIFDQACREFDQSDADFIAQSAKTRPNMLMVSGLSHLEKTIDVPNIQDWIYKYVNRLPHWMTDGLGLLTFTPHIEQPHIDEGSEAGLRESAEAHKAAGLNEIRGLTAIDRNTIDISAVHVEIDEVLKQGISEKAIQKHLLTILPDDIIHELVHYAHSQKIPLSWLREWVKVAREEDVSVSQYAEITKEHGTLGGDSPVAEDLAESIAKYTNKPVEFIVEAPKRFELIQGLLHTYPEEQIKTSLHEVQLHPDRHRAIKELAPPDERPGTKTEHLRRLGQAAAA